MSATADLLVYLTPTDVANILGMSSQGVRNLSDAGILQRAATTPRGLHLFLPEEVERVKRERRSRRQR